MILVAGGDSFIWGSELADSPNGGLNGYSLSTYPALLAKQAKLEYQCVAYPGNANNAISRMVIDYCEEHKDQNLFVFVTWTFAQRFEFRFNSPANKWTGKWYSVSSWHGSDEFEFQEPDLDADTIRKFTNMFFKHVGDNEHYEVYSVIKEVLFLQNYLDLNNIPYLFTTANNIVYESDCYTRSKDKSMINLYQQINWNRWFFFPAGTVPIKETRSPRGFYQWAVESKYKVGPDMHPLEDAHSDAAELIKEKFNELVKKSI